MPNVSIQSQTKTGDIEQPEIDELEPDDHAMEITDKQSPQKLDSTTGSVSNKHTPGSAAWYEIRKLNHKNVERRRRETINQAMEDLVAVIPGNEKNKSKILRRAVEHIKQLTEQTLSLQQQNDEYRQTNQQQQAEIAELKLRLQQQPGTSTPPSS